MSLAAPPIRPPQNKTAEKRERETKKENERKVIEPPRNAHQCRVLEPVHGTSWFFPVPGPGTSQRSRRLQSNSSPPPSSSQNLLVLLFAGSVPQYIQQPENTQLSVWIQTKAASPETLGKYYPFLPVTYHGCSNLVQFMIPICEESEQAHSA